MNPNLTILTMAEVTDIKGEKGSYTAAVKLSPRYVNENCTGCGDCAKVVEAEFERMADPTGGKLVRPSDGKEAKKVAFIQCAGSRDRNYLLHCSRICCMASLKQCTYVSDAWGKDAEISVYYIDIRAIDRFEDFYAKVQAIPQVKFIKSKPAAVVADKDSNPVVHGVDTEGYKRFADAHDLVVLAIGMEPSVDKNSFPVDIVINREGFIEAAPLNGNDHGGVFAAGCASDALDVNRAVQHATGAALRAIQVGGGATGMTSAIEAAKAGYPVHLVAEEAKLGGVWADLYKRVPFRAAAADVPNGRNVDLPKPENPGIDAMATEIEASAKITVHLSAKITKTSGAPGRFSEGRLIL